MLRLSAIFSSRRKILILWNVIQIVFLLFNHVEGIWYRPRLFISRNMNERDRERERRGEREREGDYTVCMNGEKEENCWGVWVMSACTAC